MPAHSAQRPCTYMGSVSGQRTHTSALQPRLLELGTPATCWRAVVRTCRVTTAQPTTLLFVFTTDLFLCMTQLACAFYMQCSFFLMIP